MAGRPPKPDSLHKRHGTRSKVSKGEGHESFEPEEVLELPAPPDSLKGKGLSKWTEIGEMLIGLRVLAKTDFDILESYCIAYELMCSCKLELDKNGSAAIEGANGGLVKHPSANVLKEAQTELRQVGGLLGLNPSARTKINVGKKENDKPKGIGALQKPRRGT